MSLHAPTALGARACRSGRAAALRRQCGPAGAAGARPRGRCVTCEYEADHTINPRVAGVKPSKTMGITDLAAALKASGAPVIGLAAGEPDFDTPDAILEAGIAALREGHTRYTANPGTAELRAAICAKLARDGGGVGYSPAEVVVSNGAKQSIWQGLLATCAPGDEVIIPAPYWVSYPEMAALAGATPVIVDCPASGGYQLTAAALASALTPRSRLLILCTPSNPTGAVLPSESLKAIAAVVASHPRLLVLSDEIYEHIVYPPATHVSFASLPGMRARTLTVNGFSKAYAMTGWRLGYLAAPLALATACAAIQSNTTSGPSSIAQKAGVAALGLGPGGGAPGAAMLSAFHSRRDYCVGRLTAIPHLRLVVPDGAFYLLPDCSAFFGPGVTAPGFGDIPDADALCRYLLTTAQVALVPGTAFGAPDCVRISYAASAETLREAMDRLEGALAESNFRGLGGGG